MIKYICIEDLGISTGLIFEKDETYSFDHIEKLNMFEIYDKN